MSPRVSLARIAVVFLGIGATTFGGMWAATQKLDRDLVVRTGWLDADDLQELFVVSVLIPAPKFLSLSGLIGYRLRGWWGCLVAIICLIAPASALVVAAVVLVRPELLDGPLEPLSRTIGIAVVGLLFGNAGHQLRRSRIVGRERVTGYVLTAVLFGAIVLGAPLIAVAFVGFVLGAALIRGRTPAGVGA